MKYKVCILAAGVGGRMNSFTEHINKSLLPVNFKAVISHIIEKFDINIEIVVAVGHLKESLIDYLSCAHNDRKITIVEINKFTGKGSGPGYSLMKCRKHLKIPFIFFASDTLVAEDIPAPDENWLGVAPVVDTSSYCTAKIVGGQIVRLDDKVVSKNRNAFVGVAGVKDHYTFFEALSKNTELKNNELQVSNGFSALIDHNLKPKYFIWNDTGNLDGYKEANRLMSKTDCQSSSDMRIKRLSFVMPALLIKMSTEPIASTACFGNSSTACMSLRLHGNTKDLSPSSSAKACSGSIRVPLIPTLAPALCRTRATSAPIPPEAPVIRADFSLKSNIITSSI